MRSYKILLSTVLFCLSVGISSAQIGLLPLKSNISIQQYLTTHPDYTWGESNKLGKWGKKDTLNLPFFEDFTSTTLFPDSSKWLNNQVFINSDFAINPPSYGVATFDFLNEKGHPYSPLEVSGTRGGDSLTSQPINLKDSLGIPYSLADSFVFSFYYQTKGYGDLITEDDSLRLEFLDVNGNWKLMWSKGGDQEVPFRQVILPIKNTVYLHKAFQFRFINITHFWGNNNHWHVDYIYLNTDRKISEKFYDDYAIQSRPTSLLKNYFSMPYDHFMADPSEAADSIFFNVYNGNQIAINAEIRYQEWNNGNSLVLTNYADNAGNVPGAGNAQRKTKSYNFTGLSGLPVVINREYSVRESGRTNPVLFQGNDKISVDQVFERYYAYDDGTAESGFGFNDLRDEDGKVVLQFDLKKSDSLLAIAMYLTHNINDLSKQRFTLQVWQDIEFGGGTDQLLYEETFITDSLRTNSVVNGFVILEIKKPMLLPAGKFYVGWSQNRNYNLGVGFDKNNGYLPSGRTMNKNLFFNVGDGWLQNKNAALVGAPMIRPIFGVTDPWNVGVNNTETSQPSIYPNPTNEWIYLPDNIKDIQVINLQGVNQSCLLSNGKVNVRHLAEGIYFIQMMDEKNVGYKLKFIKIN